MSEEETIERTREDEREDLSPSTLPRREGRWHVAGEVIKTERGQTKQRFEFPPPLRMPGPLIVGRFPQWPGKTPEPIFANLENI
jgi:hypothetical protein